MSNSKMSDFRNERLGVTHAARLLGVSVVELKTAVQLNTSLRGVTLPQPMIRKAGHYQWLAGDIMDCAEAITGGAKVSCKATNKSL